MKTKNQTKLNICFTQGPFRNFSWGGAFLIIARKVWVPLMRIGKIWDYQI